MAKKTVGYKEPASYFNDAMRNEAAKWDKEHPGAKRPAAKKPAAKKPAAKKPAGGKKNK